MSFLYVLLVIDAIALWHKEGMSSRSGVSLIWSTFAACVSVGLASNWWSGSGGFWCARCVVCGFMWIWRLAELRNLIRRL